MDDAQGQASSAGRACLQEPLRRFKKKIRVWFSSTAVEQVLVEDVCGRQSIGDELIGPWYQEPAAPVRARCDHRQRGVFLFFPQKGGRTWNPTDFRHGGLVRGSRDPSSWRPAAVTNSVVDRVHAILHGPLLVGVQVQHVGLAFHPGCRTPHVVQCGRSARKSPRNAKTIPTAPGRGRRPPWPGPGSWPHRRETDTRLHCRRRRRPAVVRQTTFPPLTAPLCMHRPGGRKCRTPRGQRPLIAESHEGQPEYLRPKGLVPVIPRTRPWIPEVMNIVVLQKIQAAGWSPMLARSGLGVIRHSHKSA